MKLNQSGMTLVGVLIAAAIMGIISMGVMGLFENINKGQRDVATVADEMEVRNLVRMILSNDNFCRVSIAGEGETLFPKNPVKFYREDIDEDENDEGLDVELFFSNPAGNKRTKKMLSSSDPQKSLIGNLKIQELKLIMNNGSPGNYEPSTNHYDVGILKVLMLKKGSKKTKKAEFPVYVGMKTDELGETTIVSCSRVVAEAQVNKNPTLLAIHSQTQSIPECPSKNWEKLWEGYSYLKSKGENGASSNQDLGSAGSCLKDFRTMAFMECTALGGAGGRCDYQTPGDRSYWLSTLSNNESSENDMTKIKKKISRCVVCAAPIKVTTVHSQTTSIPDCPSPKWTRLWAGYSFLMSVGDGGVHSTQKLASAGSCLKVLKTMPFISCQGTGSATTGECDYQMPEDKSYWLTSRTVEEAFVPASAISLRASRCSVCAYE